MTNDYIKKITKYYSDSLNASESYKKVKWGSKASQQLRFKILTEISLSIFNSRVLDYGCGTGELCAFLELFSFSGEYSGYDLLLPMIEEAKKKHPSYYFSDNLPQSDIEFVVASGIFTLSSPQEMYTEIRKMFELSSKGVAFNSLSSWASKIEKGEFYANPIQTIAFCRTLTPKVVLRHDYMVHDFTVYLYK
jgi:SAM-dependent methyltransferase